MLTMSVNRWMVSLTLCFMCVSAYDPQNKVDFCNQDMCETHKIRSSLGSTVLLPCTFTNNSISSASWNHNGTALIHFSDKYIEFRDPRDDRVSVYPNQLSEGNYSISIDELEHSDLGCYRCEHRHGCIQVELSVKQETQKPITLLICICSGVAASVILGVGGYYCKKYTMCCFKRKEYNVNNPVSAGAVGSNDDHPVYENCEPANSTRNDNNLPGLHVVHRNAPTEAFSLNLDHFNLVRTESQRTYITVIQ